MNIFGETFVDAVLQNIANYAFREAVGSEGWLDVDWRSENDHPMKLIFPFQKEFYELKKQAQEIATLKQVDLVWLEERDWEDEENKVFFNRQLLLVNRKTLSASTGKCSKKEFMFLVDGPAMHLAQMGCLYKYLVNQRVIKSEKRPFRKFLAD